MDDADAHIYTTTTIMHGEQEAKTEDDDHNNLIRGALQAGLAKVINRELSEAPGTTRPYHLCQICPTAGCMECTYVKRTYICIFANTNKMCSFIFLCTLVHWHVLIYFSTRRVVTFLSKHSESKSSGTCVEVD
jgi:hypothetical protein